METEEQDGDWRATLSLDMSGGEGEPKFLVYNASDWVDSEDAAVAELMAMTVDPADSITVAAFCGLA